MRSGILMRWLILTLAVLLTAYMMDGIQANGFFSAFFAAAVLGILNALLRPILLLLTLPINILSLGLFTFLINAALLKTASRVIPGFEVYGFWSAIFGALLISLISGLFTLLISDSGGVTYIDLKKTDDDRWE